MWRRVENFSSPADARCVTLILPNSCQRHRGRVDCISKAFRAQGWKVLASSPGMNYTGEVKGWVTYPMGGEIKEGLRNDVSGSFKMRDSNKEESFL